MISFIVNDTKVDQVIYLYSDIIKIINNLPKIYLQLQNKMPINLILFDIKTILTKFLVVRKNGEYQYSSIKIFFGRNL